MSNKQIDPKVLSRVKKLLALAADGGATEAEAALAAERARAMMAEHGITNATVEAAGGEGETRVKDGRTGHVSKRWMRDIMRALAEQSFVHADWYGASEYTGKRGRWELFGRESAVVTVKLMHEYLVRTVDRAARERGTPTDEIFKSAMGDRIAERVKERHERAMREQATAAQEQNQQAQQSASTNALVVVLEDYAAKERDLNEDLRLGLAPGTTRRKREEAKMENQRRLAERQAKRDALLAEGVSADVVEMMLYGYSREKAESICSASKPVHKEETEAQRRRREAREAREDQEWRDRYYRQQEREYAKRNHPSARAGRAAGNSVGLDTQVDRREQRKLES